MSDLEVESVPIESVFADPSNARLHNEKNLKSIVGSLARFGQQKPIVVDGDGIIRAGNGTHEAAKLLGWKSISIVRTSLTGSDATAYAIADNRTAELALWDLPALSETLASLKAEDFDLAELGWAENELEPLLRGNWEPAPTELESEDPYSVNDGVALTFSKDQYEKMREKLGPVPDDKRLADLVFDSVMR